MSTQPRSTTLPTCGYEGNSEVYGLGIRVGVYLQWISGLLSKAFLEEKELRDVLNENAIFLLAIFLATILLVTGTISGVHSVDILIMLHIFFGSIYTIFVDEHILARIEYFSSLMGILFKSGVATGMAAIGVWFWFYDAPVPLNPECSQYAFLFGRVGFYSRGTIMAFKAFAVINLIACALAMLSTIYVRVNVWRFEAFLVSKPFPSEEPLQSTDKPSMGIKLRRWIISGSTPAKKDHWEQLRTLKIQAAKEFQKKLKHAHHEDPDGPLGKLFGRFEYARKFVDYPVERMLDQQQNIFEGSVLGEKYPGLVGLFAVSRRYVPPTETKPMKNKTLQEFVNRVAQQASVLATNVAIMVYSIVNIELLIRYNNITGVYTLLSTSQIIPFTIGIANLWKTCWKIITDNAEHEVAGTQDEENADDKDDRSVPALAVNHSSDKFEQPVVASGALDAVESSTQERQ